MSSLRGQWQQPPRINRRESRAGSSRGMQSSSNLSNTPSRVDNGGGQRKSQHSSNIHEGEGKRRCNDYVDMKEYNTIEDSIQVAFENDYFSAQKMPVVWTHLSRLVQGPKQAKKHRRGQQQLDRKLNALVDRTIEGLQEYGPIQLPQTALGMAKIIQAVCTCGTCGYQLSRLFHGALVGRKDNLFQEIASVAVPLLPRFDPQSYANLAYACAVARVMPTFQGRTLFEHLTGVLVARKDLRSFNSQGLSNIVWAYATAQVSDTRLFDKVAYEINEYRALSTFESQELSNIVWAFAKAHVADTCLFDKVAYEMIEYRNLSTFQPQHLSNIVWAFATAKIPALDMFERVAREVLARNLGTFQPQHLSNIVWAFAKAKIPALDLLKKVAYEVTSCRDLSTFKPQELSNIVWAFSKTEVLHPDLFYSLGSAIVKRKREFNSQQVSNILWAYATLGIAGAHLFKVLAPRAEDLLEQCNCQELANIAWSYAVANVDAPRIFNERFLSLLHGKMDILNTENRSQLRQWHLWQRYERFNAGLQPVLAEKCHKEFTSQGASSSKLQAEVVDQLRSIGLEPKEEVLTPRGFSLDALVEVGGKKVGIEVDGPSHFIGPSQTPTGSTVLKRRQIAAVEGIKLVSIPYWDWDELGQDHGKKCQYLCSRLHMID